MKLYFKILRTGAILIILIIVAMFIASLLMRDKVAGIILKSLNKDISTKFETGSVNLSFLKRFPKATLDLKDVLVHSSPGFDLTCFSDTDTDTLLSAVSVSLDFSLMDIINGIYYIERIGIKEGSLKVLTDTSGLVNYNITSGDSSQSGKVLTINLAGVDVEDIQAIYDNRATKLIIGGIIENGRLKSRISGDNIDFTAKGDLRIDLFKLYNFRIVKSVETEVDVTLQSTPGGVRFEKSTLIFDNSKYGLVGSVSSDDILDLEVTGEEIDISNIKSYLPENIAGKLAAYNPVGVLNVESRIRGPLTRTANPGIDIKFSVQKGEVSHMNSTLAIKNMSFAGFFTNGTGMVPKTSSLTFSDFKGTLGSSAYTGSLKLSDFTALRGALQLEGKLIPSELKQFFGLKYISNAEGSADLNLKMEGTIPHKEKYTFADFLALNPVADLNLKSLGIGLKNDKIVLNNISGILSVSETVNARDLHLTYKDQHILLNGTFVNLPDWLSGAPVTMTASASIECDKLVAESFLPEASDADTSSEGKRAWMLPGDMILDVDFNIGNFHYKAFSAENISGVLSYEPGIMNFKTLKLNSLNGVISGDGFFVQNNNKTYFGRGSFVLEEININKAFTVFKNFGQDFLKAENLNGTVSGSLSVLIPMDSLMHPVIKSISAEGKYLIKNGALVNFEPVRALSKFIEVSELENISFEELENDFFIRNNFLYIPQMDVKSSAADLSVNGRHGFDNEYEYHVKILLSEILSRKIRKPKPNTTEFGAVKDDGLGRTSLLLKVENVGDNVRVGYDMKAAGNQIKTEIKAERQTLKTILNEEYGWFRGDSSASKKPTTSSPRFRISWDEADTSKVQSKEPSPEKEGNVIKNLLKKK